MHITHMKCHFRCKTGRMSSTSGNNSLASATSYSGASTLTGGVGGALSLMGCVREASPPPQNHRTLDLGDLAMQRHADLLPKEPKKRRFHPLRGLRRIFRRKSRSAADAAFDSHNDRNDPVTHDREDMTLRHPAGRTEDARSQSASELLTDSCDCQSGFLRRGGGVQETFTKLRGASGQLSVSHDSVFPGEVPHTRPLSSLDTLATFQRRQGKTNEEVNKSHGINGASNNRISLRVLEQIKTAIESRNQLASAETHVPLASGEHYQQETNESRFSRTDKRERIDREDAEEKFRVTRTQPDNNDKIATLPKEDLPELESDSLNHTAAHHRISVRPKNRRPPRRSVTTTNSSMSCSTITTISETSDVLDSLEMSTVTSSNASTPIETKGITVMRKSSSRLSSRTSDLFEEFDVKKKPSSMASLSPDSLDVSITRINEQTDVQNCSGDIKFISRKSTGNRQVTKLSNVYDELEVQPKKRTSITRLSKSPDSLDNSFSKSSEGFDKLIEDEEALPTFGRLQSLISKSTDGFNKLVEHDVEIKPMPRRLTNMISKSTDGFETSPDREEPRPARRPNNLGYKFSDTVSKSSDSLEAIQALVSDDSIERRRSSFEIRPRRTHKTMSMSSDNFGSLDHQQPELQKISSTSDVYLTRVNKHHGKMVNVMSKSTDNFQVIDNQETSRCNIDFKHNYKSYKRTISSESSDNLELEDEVETRKVRKPPKKIPNSVMGMYPGDDYDKEDYDRRLSLMRKSPTPRLQKSSESSELGSTDTLDSEKRNKSDSTETLDSLDKDLEQDPRDDDMPNNINNDKYDKNCSWTMKTVENKQNTENADGMEEDSKSLNYSDKPYWRQSSESKENIDIHQLLTIVSRITDNGNNQRNSVPYTKKLTTSPPSSPVVKQEDNKLLFNNLLTTKNDEELQNMLNGNISEVSTDTKSFKEKLIMFEKLGK